MDEWVTNYFIKMKPEQKIALKTLHEAGHGCVFISRQLCINENTVKSAIRKINLLKDMPPKPKSKGAIQGRDPLRIARYISSHPFSSSAQVVDALHLDITPSTMRNYFKHAGIVRKRAQKGKSHRDGYTINDYHPKDREVVAYHSECEIEDSSDEEYVDK